MSEQPLPCGELLKRLNEFMIKNANSELQEQGITFSQMKMLVALAHREDGSATLKELERHFEVTQATIAGTATRLERKGLVESYIDAADRRIKHIRLSEKGREICRSSYETAAKNEEWLLHALDDAEKEELGRLLLKVYDSLHTCDA